MSHKPAVLDDYLELVTYGFTNPMPDANEGPWKITAKDVMNGEINFGTARKTTQEAYDKNLTNKSRPKIGDVLLTKDGTLGRLAIVKQEGLCISQSVAVLRTNQNLLPEYLFYLLTTQKYQRQMIGDSDGTVIKHIYITRVGKMEVNIPSVAEQKLRLNYLVVLDEKIRINQQINQTLEQMAQAIFKSWFVDFEPVKAKMAALEAGGSEDDALLAAMQAIAGSALFATDAADADAQTQLARLQTEHPEQYATLRATAELFPSTMQESELGEIPEGWEPVRLEHYIELAYGKALKKTDRVEGPYRVYGSGGITGTHNDFLVQGPSIILGRKGTIGSIYWENQNFYPIDTTYYVIVKNGCTLSFAYYLLQTLGLKGMNTDAAVPGLNRNNVYRLETPCYPKAIIDRFTEMAASNFSKIANCNAENLSLVELRDTLLPKLLSGELSISAATDQITQAEEAIDV